MPEDQLAKLLREYLDIEAAPMSVGAGESITDTYAAGHDAIAIGPDYDDTDDFPIELDVPGDRTLHLHGAGPMATTLGATVDVDDRPLVRVKGAGSEGYGRAITVAGIGFASGAPGLELQACPQSSVGDCYARCAGAGFAVATHGSGAGTYGTTWTNCQAWGCGGHGFFFDGDAAPHGATFRSCHAVANRGHGFRLRGTNWRLRGGSSQLNYGWGIEARGGMSGLVDGVYIEGNARGADNEFPVEVYGRNHDGASVENCYCHGIYPRAVEHDFKRPQRALNIHNSDSWTVDDCTFRRYADAATAWFDCSAVDVRAPSHLVSETRLISPDGDSDLLSFGEPWTPEEDSS